MADIPYSHGWHEVARNVYAYLQPNGSWGLSNCGLIHSSDAALLVDTPFTLALTRGMLADLATSIPGVRPTACVITHANGDHCWGTQIFGDLPIYGSAATARGMTAEIPPDTMTAMREHSPQTTPLGAYARKFFGRFDFSGITLTPPNHTFCGHATVDVGGRGVQLIEVGPAHTDGDVIVVADDVVFGGDIVWVDDHPVMWSGSVTGWLAACDQILSTGAQVVVPGHGPVTDPDGVRRFRDYLCRVAAHAEAQCAAGVPAEAAAAGMPLDGYQDWGHPERLVLTVGAIYRGLGQDPGPREVLIHKMAQHWWDTA